MSETSVPHDEHSENSGPVSVTSFSEDWEDITSEQEIYTSPGQRENLSEDQTSPSVFPDGTAPDQRNGSSLDKGNSQRPTPGNTHPSRPSNHSSSTPRQNIPASGDFNLATCDTGYLDSSTTLYRASRRSISTDTSTDSSEDSSTDEERSPGVGDGKKEPPAATTGEKQEMPDPKKGFGEMVFFSGDILGIEPPTGLYRFSSIPWNTRRRFIDIESGGQQRYIPIKLKNISRRPRLEDALPEKHFNVLDFPKTSYHPKVYASHKPEHNDNIPRALIVERTKRLYMSMHVGKLLADMNVLVDEFYPPKVAFQGKLFFVNYHPISSTKNQNLLDKLFPPSGGTKISGPPDDQKTDPLPKSKITLSRRTRETTDTHRTTATTASKGENSYPRLEPHRIRRTGEFHFFPLGMFDSWDYASRLPREWFQLALKNGCQYAVPARAFLEHLKYEDEDLIFRFPSSSSISLNPGSHSSSGSPDFFTIHNKMINGWTDVGIRTWIPDCDRYVVSPVAHPELYYSVPRLYLNLRAENPARFAARVKSAIRMRKEQEGRLKYNIFLSSIPLDVKALPELEETQLMDIIASVLRGHVTPVTSERQQRLREDIEHFHAQCFAKENYRYNRTSSSREWLYHSCMSVLDEEFHITIPEVPGRVVRTDRGTVQSGGAATDFRESLRLMRTKFLFTQRPITDAMGLIVMACQRMSDESFYAYDMPPLTLLDFKQAQFLQISAIMNIIHGEWSTSIAQVLKEAFTLAGTWYDVHVENWHVYKSSKMSDLMTLVKFHMESCIRTIVTRSCTEFSDYIVKACNSSEEDTTTVFFITLSISSEKGPYYRTKLEDFNKILNEIYVRPIDACHKIVQLEASILTKFKFPRDMYMASLGFIEDDAVKPQQRLKSAIQAAIIPLQEYANRFEQYVEFYNMSVEEYIEEFEEMNHPAVIVRDEIAEQVAYMDKIDTEIPNSITMGPFYIDITDLKSHLFEKSQELYTGICTSFENRLSSLMREAMLTYEYWYNALCEPITQVEKYMDLVKRLETVPTIVQEQDKNIRFVQKDYDVLEYFKFLMKEESFETKYQALIWPYKIRAKIDYFMDKMEEELEKFTRMEIKDEVAFQERLSLIFSLFTMLVDEHDMEKVHEIANEFRKAWKQLLEIDEFGELLNLRQDLLKIPVTPFVRSKELIVDIKKYKDFWTSASDFAKFFQQWTERPLKQLNLENIQMSFSEMYRSICESEDHFKQQEEMLKNVIDTKAEMEKFKKDLLPILSILMNPNFRGEHWEEFGDAIGYTNFSITEKMSLDKFLTMNNVQENLNLLKKINHRVNMECGGMPEVDSEVEDDENEEDWTSIGSSEM